MNYSSDIQYIFVCIHGINAENYLKKFRFFLVTLKLLRQHC
uniref:Uncharacterized protein n=1 Tax=Cryptosporidium parvum TaxID=5807 RepID=F0X5S3_CRYPV